MKRQTIGFSLLCGLTIGVALMGAAGPPSIDAAFQKFWDARSPQDAAKAGPDIVSSGVTFADALARL